MGDPWFKFYAGDFLLDPRVDGLSLEGQGILIRLWCLCWRDQFIPSDPRALARRSMVDPKAMMRNFEQIKAFFEETPEGLSSSRMEKERAESRARSESHRLGARSTNAKRWGSDSVSDGEVIAERVAKRPIERPIERVAELSPSDTDTDTEKKKEKKPAPPSAAPDQTRKPRKAEMPKAGPTVSQILGEFDPASYWALSKVFPGARSSNHRTAAIYWVAAITDGVSGPALVKAGKAFFDSLPPDQVSKGAIPQLSKWLEQEGYRSFLPEDSPKLATASSESERRASLANADAFLKAKCENPSLTFAEWSMNHAA